MGAKLGDQNLIGMKENNMSEWLLDFSTENSEWSVEAVKRATSETYKLDLSENMYLLDPQIGQGDNYLYINRDVCRPGLSFFPRFKWSAPKSALYALNFSFSLLNEVNIGGSVIRIHKNKGFDIENKIVYSEVSEFSAVLSFDKDEFLCIEIDYVTHLNSGDVLFYMEANQIFEKKDMFVNFKTRMPENWIKMSDELGIANLNNGINPEFSNYLRRTSINESVINDSANPVLWSEVQKVFAERSRLGASRLFNAEMILK